MDTNLSIHLKALGYNLDIDFMYSPASTVASAYGNGRNCEVNQYVVSSTTAGSVFLAYGDNTQYAYDRVGTSLGITTYTANSSEYNPNTLIYDGTYFRETLANGAQMVYSMHTSDSPPKYELTAAISAQGAIATFNYGSGPLAGLLQSVQTADNRLVTFAYGAGSPVSLLSTIEDWGDRVWSFSYDASQNLTQYTTPVGCSAKFTVYPPGPNVGLLLSTQDSNGFITQYGYTSNRQPA